MGLIKTNMGDYEGYLTVAGFELAAGATRIIIEHNMPKRLSLPGGGGGGQSPVAQASVLVASPEHSAPPFCGAGLSQRRANVSMPPPQVTGHAVSMDHSDQAPFTGADE